MKKNKLELVKFDNLYARLRQDFSQITDHRAANASHRLIDVLSSGFALFSLKSPSLLAFEKRSEAERANLHQIYQLDKIPSDSQMRLVLDKVDPSTLRSCFRSLFDQLLEINLVKDYHFFDGRPIVSIDGVEHFNSTKVHCKNCIQSKRANQERCYRHAMLAAVMVHPAHKEVIPIDCEAIKRQDGAQKNDCELNAAKRLLRSLAKQYQDQNFVIVEDALYANAPHIRQIEELSWQYIINVKPTKHKKLFAQLNSRLEYEGAREHEVVDEKGNKHYFKFTSEVALGEKSRLRTNFVYYEQHSPSGQIRRFSWITNIPLNISSVIKIMRAGRARWKIENETFNTLKNQGYHFEHNYGHGQQFLCTVLALLMFLAFTVDQIQQRWSPLFKALHQGLGTKKKLWEALRSFFKVLPCHSMDQLMGTIAKAYSVQLE